MSAFAARHRALEPGADGEAVVAEAPPQPIPGLALVPQPRANGGVASDHEQPSTGETGAAMLMRLAGEARIFRGVDNRFYAEVPSGGQQEVHELNSSAFAYWLIRRIRDERKTVPSLEGLQRLIRTLEADAFALDSSEAVWVRVAAGNALSGAREQGVHDHCNRVPPQHAAGGVYYVDLGDSSREAVEIRAEGCRLVSRPPVAFSRPPGLGPLPRPSWDGSIELLKKYVNVADVDFPLLVAWATAALRPVGPYPILILSGEQGSAKSTLARVLRWLIDPSTAALRALPGSQRDFMIEATNTWLLAYDNVSTISTALSDGLCRIATGGGFSTRALFSDHGNTLFDVKRPTIFTGIDDFVHRSDLIDRCIILHLPPIPDGNRRLEQTLWEEFQADYPRILGALLMAVSGGLRVWPTVKITALPRMADFAHWGEAVSRGLDWEAGSFLARYKANRRDACSSALADCPVAQAVRELLEYFGRPMEETASELLALLAGFASHQIKRSALWPKNARALSVALRRIAPQLRIIGVTIRFGLGPKERLISISSDQCEGTARDGFPDHKSRGQS
jgi:hypothetical protein